MTLPAIPQDPEFNYGVPAFPTDMKLKYMPELAQRAADMASFGATTAQIAERLGVTKPTLDRWMNTYAEFNEALTMNMEQADERVKRSLYQRAVGYEYATEEIRTVSIGDGMSEIVRVPTVVHVPADPKAAMDWLRKRDPDNWGDKGIKAGEGISVTLQLNYE